MNDLVIMKNKQAVTSSLQVAEVFKKEHKNILRDINNLEIDRLNFEHMFMAGNEPDSYGRDRKVIYMNRDGFTLLAMGFTGKKAMGFKLQYIEAFNKMEHQIQTGGFQIPHTMADALRLAADQAEKNELMKPKVLFADSVATSKTTILIGELAKVLRGNGVDIGANRLFEWMRTNGYLISRKGTDWNMPTQKSMDLALFKIKETSISHSDGSVTVSKTTKVTGKGQQYFINKFLAVVS
ncbi:phage antirepressor KilAC domain-containing protein [Pediococcus ethanolidurans]|uniref:phage antirepressor KilAC domain-containing protein n=1 Tax=Pediococcus ethanolidurans TaxID=319653 RepID=UPI001C1E9672|nr:phage antirepressor KilAC domain-containing protein [Pediococcus ethanolidurans]MBU7562640.1 phage antirepressor KilAC domain-containing protein [Pediococcus ethanolidurans]